MHKSENENKVVTRQPLAARIGTAMLVGGLLLPATTAMTSHTALANGFHSQGAKAANLGTWGGRNFACSDNDFDNDFDDDFFDDDFFFDHPHHGRFDHHFDRREDCENINVFVNVRNEQKVNINDHDHKNKHKD